MVIKSAAEVISFTITRYAWVHQEFKSFSHKLTTEFKANVTYAVAQHKKETNQKQFQSNYTHTQSCKQNNGKTYKIAKC